MAQVTTKVQERVDFLLQYLAEAWQNLPRVDGEIDEWDLVEQIDYVEEWAPKEALLSELDRYAASSLLNTAQHDRYSQLKRLVALHRPLLEKLRAS